jgi:hypothetical protein
LGTARGLAGRYKNRPAIKSTGTVTANGTLDTPILPETSQKRLPLTTKRKLAKAMSGDMISNFSRVVDDVRFALLFSEDAQIYPRLLSAEAEDPCCDLATAHPYRSILRRPGV